MPTVHAQPLISVADVRASSAFYQRLLGVTGGHGGDEYERLWDDGTLVLQLHHDGTEHHHGALADPGVPRGNGVLVWFGVRDFDAAVDGARELGAPVDAEVHTNPNSGARELWLRDPDDYRVVLADLHTDFDLGAG